MAFEKAFQELKREIRRLHDVLLALRVTVVEDHPVEGGTLLAESLGDVAEELLAEVREVLAQAQDGERAAIPPADTERARAALAACQMRLNPLQRRFFTDLDRYERLTEVARLGRERGREWKAWAGSVRQGIESCREPFWAAQEALAVCWRDLAERAGANSISVHAVNIGRHVTVASAEAADLERDLLKATS